MKKFTQVYAVLLMFFVLSNVFFQPVYATETIPQSELDYLNNKNRQLEDELQSLREKINELESAPKAVATSPKIHLQDPSVISIKGGRTETAELTVKNIGTSAARNVLIQATAAADAPFYVTFLDKSNAISSISNGGSKKLKMEITIAKDAVTGSYPVTLTYSYASDNGTLSNNTDTLYIKIENDAANVNVIMYDFTCSKNFLSAGDFFALNARLENTSVQQASDVQVVVEGLKSTEIYLTNSSSSAYHKSIKPNTSEDVSFQLAASSKIKNGSYPIEFKIKYRDPAGKALENSYTYYVNIGGGLAQEDLAQLELNLLEGPSTPMEVGQSFSIQSTLKNTSSKPAKNIKIVAESTDKDAVVPRSANTQLIRSLDAGETREITFSFSPTSKANTQNYSIGFTVTYETGSINEDGSQETLSFTQYSGVNVNNPDADKTDEDTSKISMPKIIVSRYASEPTIVKAGHEFTLSIIFQNTHKEKPIENVKAFLTAVEESEKKGNVFTPVDSSNTFYIDHIPPRGEVEKVLKMYTVPDANPKNYIITVNFEYEDAEHTQYKSTEQVGINVKQATKFEMGDINAPTSASIGQPSTVYFEFYNTGKVTLSNLMIKLIGDFDATNSSSYYSNFTPGYSEFYEGTFIPTKQGNVAGQIVITYEDDTGEKIEEIKEFNVNVMEPTPMGEMGGMEGVVNGPGGQPMGMPGQPLSIKDKILNTLKNPLVIGGIIAGVVIMGLVVFFAARRIVKKKRSQDMDE